jgi:hypothetical protein
MESLGCEAVVVDSLMPTLVALREVAEQQAINQPFQRLFGYWHLLHLPLATVLMLVTVVHVAVAFAFGYFWIQ